MVLTYSHARPDKDWVLRQDTAIDGDSLSYLDMMERNTMEEVRRARERQMMEEGKAMWKQKRSEDLQMEIKDQEQIRELSRLKLFGRPGHGAPTTNVRKKRFTEHQLADDQSRHLLKMQLERGGGFSWAAAARGGGDDARPQSPPMLASANSNGMVPNGIAPGGDRMSRSMDGGSDALSFGRPGYGAPVRTKSGRIRTIIRGNPEIRFQDNSSVRKTINNSIRYQADPEWKAQYHKDLEEQVRQRKENERAQRERDRNIAQQLEHVEGSQWGRPGPGGTYWRGSTVTGQGFFDKMGWCGSADPRKRHFDVRHHEAEDMKKEMAEVRHRKDEEHQQINSGVGIELVPLLKEKPTGKPRKDPATGYLMNHSLPSTDAESLYPSRAHPEERKHYYDTLNSQIQNKETAKVQSRKHEEEEQVKHFQSWESFWGRPGYGAPRDGHAAGAGTHGKENLMKILHYPDQEKVPNSVELITLERLPVK